MPKATSTKPWRTIIAELPLRPKATSTAHRPITIRRSRLDPKLALAYVKRGNIYTAKGDLDGAMEDYDKALALDPKLVVAYSGRGIIYKAKGDLDRAMADYDTALALDQKHVMAYNNRGNIYSTKGDLDRAMADYDKALEINPKFALAYNNRGNIYKTKGDLDRAFVDFDKALALDPRYSTAYENRAYAYWAKGDLDRALADFDKTLALDPKSVRAYFGRSLAAFYSNKFPVAISDAYQALELNPKYAYAAIWLDIIEQRSHTPGRLSEASQRLDMTIWPAPVVRLFLGQLTPESMLAAAEFPDALKREGQICEANFFAGEWALRQDFAHGGGAFFQTGIERLPTQLHRIFGGKFGIEGAW